MLRFPLTIPLAITCQLCIVPRFPHKHSGVGHKWASKIGFQCKLSMEIRFLSTAGKSIHPRPPATNEVHYWPSTDSRRSSPGRPPSVLAETLQWNIEHCQVQCISLRIIPLDEDARRMYLEDCVD